MAAKKSQEKNDTNNSRSLSRPTFTPRHAGEFEQGVVSIADNYQFATQGAHRQVPNDEMIRASAERIGNNFPTAAAESWGLEHTRSSWIDLEPTPLSSQSFPSKLTFDGRGSTFDGDNIGYEHYVGMSTNQILVDAYCRNSFPLGELAETATEPVVTDESRSVVSATDSDLATTQTTDMDLCGSLLHESCRLYPTTKAVVESALRLNPPCIRQRRQQGKMSPMCNKKTIMSSSTASASPFPTACTLPMNIALENGASLDVVQLLVQEYPDAVLEEDGPQGCGSLSVALYHSASTEIILTLILAKPDSVKLVDKRHSNLPLHVACAKGASYDVIQTLVQLFPNSLHHRNFHGQTPLDICQRHSSVCSDRVTDFLEEATFRNATFDLEEILDHGLDAEEEDL